MGVMVVPCVHGRFIPKSKIKEKIDTISYSCNVNICACFVLSTDNGIITISENHPVHSNLRMLNILSSVTSLTK